jgi:hypothetical protein
MLNGNFGSCDYGDGVACLLLRYSGFVFRRFVPVASCGFSGVFVTF